MAGRELNRENIKFPNRYLLLKELHDNKSLVADFGDFSPHDVDKLLRVFVANQRDLEVYSGAIFDLLGEVNDWVDLTGGELVVDARMFRMRRQIAAGSWQPGQIVGKRRG